MNTLTAIAPDVAQSTVAPQPDLVEPIRQVVEQYFDTLNRQNFQATAALFAEDGVLYPPFEAGVVGPVAIAHYLASEAIGIELCPHHAIIEPLEDGNFQVRVTGKVQMPLFGVNVSWNFVVSPQLQLCAVGIRLLAALEDLLRLKNS